MPGAIVIRAPPINMGVAQLAERRSPKPQAGGSRPSTHANERVPVPVTLLHAGVLSDRFLERCPSGLRALFGKQMVSVSWRRGSNPRLSANSSVNVSRTGNVGPESAIHPENVPNGNDSTMPKSPPELVMLGCLPRCGGFDSRLGRQQKAHSI